jgi:NAD(P)-dependent dehydrogenase (short-subunit alcohol dehydrogenase family)
MKSALITGANKGIGFETVKILSNQGLFVYVGSRDINKGNEAVQQLTKQGYKNLKAIAIDVTNNDSIEEAKTLVEKEQGKLDVLINNAGISGVKFDESGNLLPQTRTAIDTPIDVYQQVFDTNLYGVIRVTQAFLPLLKKSNEPKIVNVSSTVGSLSLQSDPSWPAYDIAKYAAYSSSKSALNMFGVHLAYELKGTAFKINMVDPGYTKTDFTNYSGGEVEQAAARVAKYALIDMNGPTGSFFSEETNPETGVIPW